MSGQHFRFLHASDFALDEPLHGCRRGAGSRCAELLIDAPYLAAERVFDAAIEERVDFVVLIGRPRRSCSTPRRGRSRFCSNNFEPARLRTALRSIGPAASSIRRRTGRRLPGCPRACRSFRRSKPEELSHFRGDRPVANIVGRSWHGTSLVQVGKFKTDADGLTTIVVAYGQADAERLAEQEVDYWALGGQPQRQSLGSAHRVVHYAGSPQGRSPDEPGPHGCTLVHVAGDRTIRTQFIPTDAVRWHTETVAARDERTLAATCKSIWPTG